MINEITHDKVNENVNKNVNIKGISMDNEKIEFNLKEIMEIKDLTERNKVLDILELKLFEKLLGTTFSLYNEISCNNNN